MTRSELIAFITYDFLQHGMLNKKGQSIAQALAPYPKSLEDEVNKTLDAYEAELGKETNPEPASPKFICECVGSKGCNKNCPHAKSHKHDSPQCGGSNCIWIDSICKCVPTPDSKLLKH